MGKAIKAVIAFMVLTVAAYGQGVRFGDGQPIWSTAAITGVTALVPVGGTKINFCQSPANATPCTNYATTYTDSTLATPCSNSTQVVLAGTSSCVANTDSDGNWGVWTNPGNYQYTVTTAYGSFGPYPVTLAPGNGSVAAFKKLNTIYFASQYVSLNALAVAIGASAKTYAIIDSGYAGTDCPPNGYSNITWLDLRGIAASAGCSTNVTMMNVNDGNVNSFARDYASFSSIPVSGGVASRWMQTFFNNGTAGNTIDGISSEATITGTLTGTQAFATGNESITNVESTGGTVTNASGIFGYVAQSGTSTTNITTAIGVWGKGCNTCTGPQPADVYSLYGSDTTGQGSSRSYSIGLEGKGLLLYSNTAGSAGFDIEDATHTSLPFLYTDNANAVYFKGIGSTINFYNKAGTLGAHFDNSSVLHIDTSLVIGASGSSLTDSRALIQSVNDCGSTTTCANTANNSFHEVIGTVTLSTGAATLSSITGFTTIHGCSCTDQTSANACKAVPASASSVTFAGTGSDVLFYRCIGN